MAKIKFRDGIQHVSVCPSRHEPTHHYCITLEYVDGYVTVADWIPGIILARSILRSVRKHYRRGK
jgi:hypothetical protein